MSDDITQAARKAVLDQEALDRRRMLDVQEQPTGLYARCRACPRRTRDRRRRAVRAFYSWVVASNHEAIREWWDAHRQTEIHGWYASHLAVAVEATAEQLLLRAIFQERPQRAMKAKPPFEFAERVR